MAYPTRGKTSALKEDLFANPAAYSFFQAITLLRRFFQQEKTGDTEDVRFVYDSLRIRPHLSLAFSGSDIVELTEDDESDSFPIFHLTVSFLGLYGASSPLPTFYTEDLLDEQGEDVSVTRDFLDVVNSPLYPLLIRAVGKYRLFHQLCEIENEKVLERIYCLLGYGHKELRERIPRVQRLPRFIGLFTQWPRSAMGLRALVSTALDGSPVQVISNLPRWVVIPPDQRLILGKQCTTLGVDAHLGCQIKDLMGKIGMIVGPLGDEPYHTCLPGWDNFHWVEELVRNYLPEPIDCRLEVELAREEARPARLGDNKWNALGMDAWVFSGPEPTTPCRAVFELKPSEMRHDSCRS